MPAALLVLLPCAWARGRSVGVDIDSGHGGTNVVYNARATTCVLEPEAAESISHRKVSADDLAERNMAGAHQRMDESLFDLKPWFILSAAQFIKHRWWRRQWCSREQTATIISCCR